jgi:microcystin-dependent protein
MAQADQIVQNDTFPTFRADLNSNLAALFSNNSGAAEPTPTVAFMDWIDTSTVDPVWKKRNAANNAWIAIGTLKAGEFDSGAAIPAGTVQFYAASSAPSGWLKANGAAVSRSTYSALFAAIGTTFGSGNGSTTFNVPDLRGEFVRGLDDGRGVDSGRSLGSAQGQQIQSHRHVANASNNDANSSASQGWPAGNVHNSFRTSDRLGTDRTALIGNTGGAETRPRNIALLAVIKF